MPLYFLLGTLTFTGQRMVHDNSNLVVETTREIKVQGAEILGQYAVLGKYDYVLMAQADDNDAIARSARELSPLILTQTSPSNTRLIPLRVGTTENSPPTVTLSSIG